MSDLAAVLASFKEATRCEAAVWIDSRPGARPQSDAATYRATPPERWPEASEGAVAITTADGPALVTAVPGPRRAWLLVGPSLRDRPSLATHLKFLLPVVSHFLQASLEVEHAATELAERYEEINLLYTIGEILGRTVSLEVAARTILAEICDTVGASRASVLVHDLKSEELRVVAALGAEPASLPAISVADNSSVMAKVFRTLLPVILDPRAKLSVAEAGHREGALLSVPIVWSTPRGPEPLGVVNISGRKAGRPFTAGDQKLVAAIATQIGTAIQNARLVRASIAQQRLAHEMQLAHELQMKLLPTAAVLTPDARVAARVVPAESVGGDLYNLFHLGRGRVGALIGDVSGHGYQAALIMALVMSASAIHAQASADPARTLDALRVSLREELATTEMFLAAFYAVIDRNGLKLRYANAGHPSAFLVRANGTWERLSALDPPLGMTDDVPSAAEVPWNPEGDVLVLFTDGVSDAHNPKGERYGEARVVELVRKYRVEEPASIVDRVFKAVDRFAAGTRYRDDLTVIVLKS